MKMVRLSDIPPEILEEIRKFALSKRKEVPVTSKPRPDGTRIKTLPDLIEEKFGYRLSPSQVYTLLKGERKYTLRLDVETIRDLEEQFGSVSRGIKQLLKFYKGHRVPRHLREPHRVLVQHSPLTAQEVEELLAPFVKDRSEVWKIIGELSRLGYVSRDRDGKYVVTEYPRDPIAALVLGLFGGR
jgi:hypothetical protein